MEEVRRVVRAEVMFNIREEPWRFVTRRLDHFTFEQRQGVRHQLVPGVLITRLGRVLQQDIVTHGFDSDQAQTACKGSSCVAVISFGGISCARRIGFLTLVRHAGFFHTLRLTRCCVP